jgi:hypothetical protein
VAYVCLVPRVRVPESSLYPSYLAERQRLNEVILDFPARPFKSSSANGLTVYDQRSSTTSRSKYRYSITPWVTGIHHIRCLVVNKRHNRCKMHHKLISSRLINKGYKRDCLKIKKPTGIGSGYTSDASTESNMTSVAVDHVPLSSGLSHVVRMELGEDPIVPGEDSNSNRIYQGTCTTYPTMLHPVNDPIEQALHDVMLKQEVIEKQKSKIVRQLQLAMEKQTEYDPNESNPNATPILASVPFIKKWPEKPNGTTTNKVVASGGAAAAPSDSEPEDGKDLAVVTKNSHMSSISQKKRSHPSAPSYRSSFLARGRKAAAAVASAAGDQAQAKNKRPRTATEEWKNEDAPSSENDDGSDEDLRFRRYQNEQWTEKFDELLAFKKENGHW